MLWRCHISSSVASLLGSGRIVLRHTVGEDDWFSNCQSVPARFGTGGLNSALTVVARHIIRRNKKRGSSHLIETSFRLHNTSLTSSNKGFESTFVSDFIWIGYVGGTPGDSGQEYVVAT